MLDKAHIIILSFQRELGFLDAYREKRDELIAAIETALDGKVVFVAFVHNRTREGYFEAISVKPQTKARLKKTLTDALVQTGLDKLMKQKKIVNELPMLGSMFWSSLAGG